ncbi:MAG: hypothetical protein OER56_01705 [Hyphomicrobiales bacterium]|nr:hypothetical protein [Hyphomicrobiales bacterium]
MIGHLPPLPPLPPNATEREKRAYAARRRALMEEQMASFEWATAVVIAALIILVAVVSVNVFQSFGIKPFIVFTAGVAGFSALVWFVKRTLFP